MSERSEARIALVGDYSPAVVAHQGIQRSLVLATSRMPGLTWEWIHTAAIGADPASRLAGFTGVWVVPASPYANPEGAFAAIRYAREWPLPFFGTCGGSSMQSSSSSTMSCIWNRRPMLRCHPRRRSPLSRH